MNWSDLLSTARKGSISAKADRDLRSEFQRDYHRIIGSASFRRLQDKTQVFPLDRSDFIRTRLTHSLEVASFARSLGHMCFTYIIGSGLDDTVDDSVRTAVCDILECAGLVHDIGNPPFGHFGEDTIREWFSRNLDSLAFRGEKVTDMLTPRMKADLINFEGNAQALRLLTKLHFLVDENGMHLTYALLNTIVKYPVSSLDINRKSGNIKDKKMGYYLAEEDIFCEITKATGTDGCRYPLTFLLESADDIAYLTADTEDAVKKGFLTCQTLYSELMSSKYTDMLTDPAERDEYIRITQKLTDRYSRAEAASLSEPGLNAVQNWIIAVQAFLLSCAADSFTANYREIMNGTFTKELLAVSKGNVLAFALRDIAFRIVFSSKAIYLREISEGTMLDFLLDRFVRAAVNYDTDERMSVMDSKLMTLISENYRYIYRVYSSGKDDAEKLYLRMLLVTDYICGMTDSFARSLYLEMNGRENI